MIKNHCKRVQGTCIEVEDFGVIFRGPTGIGKSDLALRLIDSGACLIADDYTDLAIENEILIARAPKTIRHLLEVRGIGILKIGSELKVKLGVIIDLVKPEQVERRPENQSEEILGKHVPLFRLFPLEASGPVKVRLIVRQLKGEVLNIP